MSQFYSRNSLHDTTCKLAVQMFGDVITSFRREGKRMLRVLEVGAGELELRDIFYRQHIYYGRRG